MVILCAYTGGYTEIGGGEYFLRKIRNNDVHYKRITPAIEKKGPKALLKKRLTNPLQSKQIKAGKNKNTGKGLLAEVRELLRLNMNDDEYKRSSALIIFDDLDCRCLDRKERYKKAVEDFVKYVKRMDSFTEIKIIFLLADPEVEIWFCKDAGSVFEPSKSKEGHFAVKYTSKIPDEYIQEFDGNDSCQKKFSNIFAETLDKCGIIYNKRSSGSEYLRKVDPDHLAISDDYVKWAVWAIRDLQEFVTICPERS